MTGSMLIPNSIGEQTLLILTEDKATSPFEVELSLRDARAALKREKGNPSGREGNVKFLEAWIKYAQVDNLSEPSKTIVPKSTPPVSSISSVSSSPSSVSNITPSDKTSIRLTNEPWEKDTFLESSNEEESINREVQLVSQDEKQATPEQQQQQQGQSKKTVAQLIEEIKLKNKK
jgi:hypothetical protein